MTSESSLDSQKVTVGFPQNAAKPDKAVKQKRGGLSGVVVEKAPNYSSNDWHSMNVTD